MYKSSKRLRQDFPIRAALLVLLGFLALIVLLFVADNPPTDDSIYPKCTLHSVTGLHCPGCGLTRSLFSVLHGDFAQAVAYNPLSPIVLPIIFWGLFRAARMMLLGDSQVVTEAIEAPPSRWSSYWLPLLLTFGLLLFGILRNLPWEPFCWLAPHEITSMQ